MTEQTTGKGRPTPKRAKQGRGPVAPPPTDRKEAAKRLREKQAAGRKDVRASYARGDDALLFPRDQGPARKIARDVVDGRRNVLTFFTPVALVYLVGVVTRDLSVMALGFGMFLAVLLAGSVDAVFMVRALGRRLAAEVPGESTRRHVMYAVLRASSLRRLRRPKPAVPPAGFGPKR